MFFLLTILINIFSSTYLFVQTLFLASIPQRGIPEPTGKALDKLGQVTSQNLAVTQLPETGCWPRPQPPPPRSPLDAPQGPLCALVSGSDLCFPFTPIPTDPGSWQLPVTYRARWHPRGTRSSKFQNGCFMLQFKKVLLVLLVLTFLQFLLVVIVMTWDLPVIRKKTLQTWGSLELLPGPVLPPSLSQGGGDQEAGNACPVFSFSLLPCPLKKKKERILCFQTECVFTMFYVFKMYVNDLKPNSATCSYLTVALNQIKTQNKARAHVLWGLWKPHRARIMSTMDLCWERTDDFMRETLRMHHHTVRLKETRSSQ